MLSGLFACWLPARPTFTAHLLYMLRGLLALLEAALALLLLLLPGDRGTGGLLLRLGPTVRRRMARCLRWPPVRSHAVCTCRSSRSFRGRCVLMWLMGCPSAVA